MNAIVKPNLLQRINAVQKKIDYIKKDKSVSTGGGSYQAVTHDQVTAMVRDHLVANGIVILPSLVSSRVCECPPDKDGKPSRSIRYEAVYDFLICNMDDTSDHVVVRIEAHGVDNQDKAPGKVLSYCKKMAVLKVFEIETGEDDESRFGEADAFDLLGWSQRADAASTREVLEYIYSEARVAAIELNDAASLKTFGAHVKRLLAKKFTDSTGAA